MVAANVTEPPRVPRATRLAANVVTDGGRCDDAITSSACPPAVLAVITSTSTKAAAARDARRPLLFPNQILLPNLILADLA